jgi:hypothetical protein
MGAAFLQHRVQELEQSVETLSFKRDPRLFDPNAPNPSFRGGRGSGGRGQGRPRGGKAAVAHAQPERRPKDTPRRLVDVSALVHGLPVIKEWVREGACQVIVPLDGELLLQIHLLSAASDRGNSDPDSRHAQEGPCPHLHPCP